MKMHWNLYPDITQGEANRMFERPESNINLKYALACSNIIGACLTLTITPIVMLLSLVGLLLFFNNEKLAWTQLNR